MDDLKHWYHSKTIWGALISVGASMLHATGFEVTAGDQGQIVDSIVSIAGAVGGLLAVYGRLTATSAIRQPAG
ncbi:iron-containing alcohol dehydrogenase family protein [Rhizobium sp. P32RR-XVIII]|uniref:iron-containing alcohol dehydrogenase family protein n=1 Tax=Rhizobium sp. P32RR-XVIII TaxID=2726738 RepID=UPI0014567EFD|nr:iron-containing alcohol dehydrogenase family protein [Rhizobium sp. P32RR-XVIII]NLS02870.1 iron-containing alcohol dehydrogenase family protein [Rhizobium sp. P32RR-XVIII]